MKLDDYRTSDNISDQRGGGGGGGFNLPIGGGKMGIGTILILGIAALVFGINPMDLMQGGTIPGWPGGDTARWPECRAKLRGR